MAKSCSVCFVLFVCFFKVPTSYLEEKWLSATKRNSNVNYQMTNSVFSIWKTAFTRRKKTNRFFQNSPIFKSYKNLSLDLSRILFSEHQFYSPDVESEAGWKKLRKPVKYRAVVGGWRRGKILLSLSAVFKGWNLTGFSSASWEWVRRESGSLHGSAVPLETPTQQVRLEMSL